LKNYKLNNKIIDNFSNTKLTLLIPPAFLLLIIGFTFFFKNALNTEGYIETQKKMFYSLNGVLSKLPDLLFNITQLGDAIIFLPFFTVLIIYTPKFWSTLLTSSLIGLLFSVSLKKIFLIPRPAAVFDNESFTIIGRTLASTHSSLPSGHSITTFMIITTLLFAFMPKVFKAKVIWSILIFSAGLFIAFSRVGVGAHYPFDVIIGCTIGYIAALFGIYINNNIGLGTNLINKKHYPILMLFLLIWMLAIINEIMDRNLLIFYFSLSALVLTLGLTIKTYLKK
jgi:membrane-associated phospholipid phosphatase